MINTKTVEEDGSALLLISSLMENTGAHGIPNIKRAGTPFRRIVWAALFVFGLAMFVWQSSQLITAYMAREVDVNYERAYENKVDFPAVTICNMNPIKRSYLTSNEELLEIFYGDTSADESAVVVPSSSPNTSDTSRGGYQDWDNLDFTSEFEEYNQILLARDHIAYMPYDERQYTGHQLSDMLLSCSYSGYPCYPGNFTRFYNYRYGNCYTFIGRNSTYEQLSVTKPGPLYGLSLELFIEQHEYVSDIQPSAGVRIIVHPQDVMPFPEDSGVSVSPGQETSIGIKRIKVSHIPDPYSNCTTPEGIRPDNVFIRQFPDVVYNRDTCEKSCLYYELLRKCNCSDPRYRYNISDGDLCWSNSDFENRCIEGVERAYVNGEDLSVYCPCTASCSETSYEPTVSASVWPNQQYWSEVVDHIIESDHLRELYYSDEDFIQNNFAKVLIFFNELNYENIYDTEKYLWYDLLSDLGGQFGLWIGASVLTVFEFIELMNDILVVLIYKCWEVSLKRKIPLKDHKVTDRPHHSPVFAFERTDDVIT